MLPRNDRSEVRSAVTAFPLGAALREHGIRARRLAVAGLVALCAGAAAPAQTTTTCATEKKITWKMLKPAADKKGTFKWDLDALAQCLPECDKPKHLADSATWNLTTGQPAPPPKDTELQDCSVARARAQLKCTVSPAQPDPGNEAMSIIETSLIPDTYLYLEPVSNAVAKATVSGSVRIDGATASYVPLAVRKGEVKKQKNIVLVQGDGSSFYKDPIALEFYQDGVGLLASEKLFSLDVAIENGASLSWDDAAGIALEAPIVGSSRVVISGGYPSSWVTSSTGSFGAALQNGVFTPTGSWGGLPWTLVMAGPHVVKAELPAWALPATELQYTIPGSLIVPPNTYSTALVYTVGLSDGAAPCYPDCTEDSLLTVADFGCFQTKFVIADPYADCNDSGTLNIADFACFQTKFVEGCP